MAEQDERGVYREMPDVLGLAERDAEATRAFGLWRDRTRSLVLLAFAIVGAVLGAIGYYYAQEWQFAKNDGRALMLINLAGAAVPFMAMLVIGRFVGRRLVLSRTPGKLAELAAAYEIRPEKLAEVAALVNRL